MSKEYLRLNVDFIPSKIVVGKFDTHVDCHQSLIYEEQEAITGAFVTCRYKNTNWISPSVFERLCKFKPCVQRDAEKELNKVLQNAVLDFDNEPISGFSLVSVCDNLYGYSTCKYSYSGDVVVKDPRGFCVAITQENFAQMLLDCNGNMKNGVFDEDVKFVYAFGDRACLIPYESQRCKDILAKQDKAKDEKGQITYIKPSKFEVGHAYETSDCFSHDDAAKGIYVYLGQFKTYSISYIEMSIKNGKNVDLAAQIEHEKNSRCSYNWSTNFKSREDAKVFYLVKPAESMEFDRRRLYTYVNIGAKELSKKFIREVPINSSWKMLNGQPFSVEKALEEMSTMPMYSRISDETYNSFHHPAADKIKAMPLVTFAAILAAKNYKTSSDTRIKYPLHCLPFSFKGYSSDLNMMPSLVYNGILAVSDEDGYGWNRGHSGISQFSLVDIAGKSSKEIADLPISSTICTRKVDSHSNGQKVKLSSRISATHPRVLEAYMLIKPYLLDNAAFENGKPVPDHFFAHVAECWADFSNIKESSIYVSAEHLKKWKQTCDDYLKMTPEYAEWCQPRNSANLSQPITTWRY